MKNILFTIFTLINLVNVSSIRLLNIPINNEKIISIKLPEVESKINFENELIGGIDNHGCMPGAGYFYCNYTDSCKRFNEPCKFNKTFDLFESSEIPKPPESFEVPVQIDDSEEFDDPKDYSDIYVLIDLKNLLELL